MSATSEFETAARQDYGPTTSSENVYERVLDHKLAGNMSIPRVRTPVLRAMSLSPNEGDPEPDSTNLENIAHSAHNFNKEVEYHIPEKRCDTDIALDTLSGIVRLEEASLDNVDGIAYPIIQEADETNENSSTTLIRGPLNTALVQNVTKIPHNFTINVDATVSNITAIQNISQEVSGGSRTLWVPTLLTTGTPSENKIDDERSQAGMSQIIITSESYVSHENSQSGARHANIMTETNYLRPKSSKVQILSNVSLPKNSTYPQQYVNQSSKEVATPLYGTQNHVYKLNTNVISQKNYNNSMLTTKAPKSQSLIGGSTLSSNVNSNQKNVTYGHTFSKGTNLNKSLSKVNNGANLNVVVAASSGSTQCHILSRVVSGPNKLSVHSGRKANAFKGSKNSGALSSQKQSRSIKIIQQAGSSHKTDKNWQVTNMNTYKNQQPSYGIIDSSNSKIIQKVGSPTHKNQQPVSLHKVASKGERLVLQSPCGPVIISTAPVSTSLPKGPHYVQSGPTPNLRYVHTYGSDTNQVQNVSQVSANQQLTAQILKTLSQPKLMLPSNQNIINHNLPPPTLPDDYLEVKPAYPRRIVFGDPSTLLTADDIIGMEERPNLSEELRRYSFQTVAFVMLDHTYSLPAQKQPSVSTPNTVVSVGPPVTSPTPASSPQSPMKPTSPVVTSSSSTYELQQLQPLPVSTSIIGSSIPVTSIQMGALYKPQPITPQDDDAGSVISSLEGERRPDDRAGSDTETAPEVEEEGKTRCICDFTHDDGYMICCDRCGEWQHVDCMGIDRQNIPDAYMCELCHPRPIDRRHARAIQMRKREELSALGASDSDSSEGCHLSGQRRKRLLTVTTYTNTSGTCVTTYNPPPPVAPPLPTPTLSLPKRGPKRPKKTEMIRKVNKRKLTEKRVKRKKEMLLNRSKYNTTVSNQSHWQDSYESAMTNHYSPELRQKIMKYSGKLGNTPNMAAAITAHLCTTVPHAGGKILIATKDLKENTPVIELRGKYMLSNQHRPQPQNTGRAGSQKPGPFVFFYKLPKDNPQICIDTRTYGNEARFVRRSCKPNAELQHCIVKGTLHVYLVTIGPIQSNTEITVGHDSNGGKQTCACGNPKHCKVNGLNPSMVARKSIDYPPREKRSRNRCSSISSPMSPPLAPLPTTPIKDNPPLLRQIKSEKKSPIKHEYPMSPIKNVMQALDFDKSVKVEPEIKEEKPEIDLMAKEEMKPETDEVDSADPEPPEEPNVPVEEVKMEIEDPIPAMIEEVSKPEKSEVIEDNIKPENESFSEEDKPDTPDVPKEDPVVEEKLVVEEVAKSACHDRSSRSSRTCVVNQDSMDDKTDDSQDKLPTKSKEKDKKKMTREERKMEAIMKAFERMEKAQQRKQEVKERQKRRESDPHPNATEREDEEEVHASTKRRKRRKGRARTTSQSNRRRLNSADSDMVTSGDETPLVTSPPSRRVSAPNHTSDGGASEGISEDLGLSSACLLVEAAVGSVESAFKLPKTKKTMATEWVGRSPERTPSPYHSPYRSSLVSATSLESLVRVASTMIGDLSGGHSEHEADEHSSPTRTPGRDRSRPPKKSKRITRSTPPTEVIEATPSALPQHSAKKRWLRQAISEESDSPNAETSPNEMVTPLKKRRLARESLSCETNIVCNDEASPNMTSEDSPIKDDNRQTVRSCTVRNIMDSLYTRDRTRSDSGQGSDDQCNIDSDILNLKGPHDSENIRRIIGVPLPTEPPVITKMEDIKTINNNVVDNATLSEESSYNKETPMDIDVTLRPRLSEVKNEIKRTDSPQEKLNSSQSHSADTSGNSSPQRDEMDDIQKKIHSFHTENIMILKSRNKKPPKEKRKKVNLNFDLNMVDDQISIQLRTENDSSSPKSLDINGDVHDDLSNSETKIHYVSTENIPLPPVETIPLPAIENIPLPDEPLPVPPPEAIPLPDDITKPFRSQPIPIPEPVTEDIPLPDEPLPRPASPPETLPLVEESTVEPVKPESPPPIIEKPEPEVNPVEKPSVLENPLPFSSRFGTGLFSGIFSNINPQSQINENVPNMQIIQSAIDRTTSLEGSITPGDDLKSVQEILTRVNNMDSNNSVLLSGVLKSADQSNNPNSLLSTSAKCSSKPFSQRVDPRLNPPPTDKPKPVRRKLSISEYRKRLKGPPTTEVEHANPNSSSNDVTPSVGEWSSESSGAGSLSPLRLDAAAAAAADELEQRLHRALTNVPHVAKGVFDAQPTASELQRENLSSRLRREFGLALPDDEESRAPPHPADPPAPHSDRNFGQIATLQPETAAYSWKKQRASDKWGRKDAASATAVEAKRCER